MSDNTTEPTEKSRDTEPSATESSEANASNPDHPFEAAEYADGTISYPPHPVGPNGAERTGTVDLRSFEAHVITWTTSTATPPGVRQPNTLAIVEFELGDNYDGPPVRALGQIAGHGDTEGSEAGDSVYDVDIGDRVEPVYVGELRDPNVGIREPASQDWDGFRFKPVE